MELRSQSTSEGKRSQTGKPTTTRASRRRPGSRPGDAAAAEQDVTNPPYVIRGVKLHDELGQAVAGAVSREVGIDWFRVRGGRERLADGRAWLTSKFGQEAELRKGPHFFDHAEHWPSAAQLWYSDERPPAVPEAVNTDRERIEGSLADYCCVELTGGSLATVGSGVRLKWMRELLAVGFDHPTRVDVYVDWHGKGLDLVGAVERACERGELCGSRVWERHRKVKNGKLLGFTVYLGTRSSDGAGRLVRCYDKGLEQGLEAGTWQRWEVQFMQEPARTATTLLLQADALACGRMDKPLYVPGDGSEAIVGWENQAVAIALGANDFREPRKGASRSIKRRPRAAWWAEILGDVQGVRVKGSQRRETSLPAFSRYLRSQAGPTLAAIAKVTGHDLAEVFADLVAGPPIKPKKCSKVAYEYNQREYRAQFEALMASGVVG